MEITLTEEHRFFFLPDNDGLFGRVVSLYQLEIQITSLFRLFFCEVHKNMFAASHCMPCPVDGMSGTVTFRTLQNYRWNRMAATMFMVVQLCL